MALPMNDPLLALPLKKTTNLDLAKPLLGFVKATYGQAEADHLAPQFASLNSYRSAIVDHSGGKIKATEDLANSHFFPYMCLLTHVAKHFPLGGRLPLAFTWIDQTTKSKVTLPSADFELGCVSSNAAVLFHNLAGQPCTTEGAIKESFKYLQISAGLFENSKDCFKRYNDRHPGSEISLTRLEFLSSFMVTEAHHRAYLSAVKEGKFKPGILAKLAMEGSNMYGLAAGQLARPPLAGMLDKDWPKLATFYQRLLEARAHIHQAAEMQAATEIGQALGRYYKAQELLTQGCLPLAKGLGNPFTVLINSTLNDIKAKVPPLDKDNGLVYHQKVPKGTELEPVQRIGKSFAKPTPISSLSYFMSGIDDPFSHIVPPHVWELRQAFKQEIHTLVNDACTNALEGRRKARDTINECGAVGVAQSTVHRAAGLPAPLKDRISNLKASTQGKTCVNHVQEMMGAVTSLASSSRDSLARVVGQLDDEAAMDEALRAQFGPNKWNRPPSNSSNTTLRQDLNTLSHQIDQASAADKVVSDRLQGYLPDLQKLDQPLSVLDNLVPCAGAGPGADLEGAMEQVNKHLSSFQGQEQQQQELVETMRQDLIDDEDRLQKDLAKLDPNDKQGQSQLLDELRTKYKKSVAELERMTMALSVLVKSVHDANGQVSVMRKQNVDAIGSQREAAITTLDGACNKFDEVTAHLKEGLHFWGVMTEAIDRQKSKVDDWIFGRNLQKEDLAEDLRKEANMEEGERASMELIRQMREKGEIAGPGQRN
eukprot:TRINITY_DN112692_c0_g1_i1.p1 TRINITY_DN112692_c0_g1~~TRINITY_DN112692_c0_g1_i1.p1  ORF type:complete len:766 (-),score=75.74 TRINITY_DN112692_c0_g1_i1:204-2501(-)